MISSIQFVAELAQTTVRKDVLLSLTKNSISITSKVNTETTNLVDAYVNEKISSANSNVIGSSNSFDITTQNNDETNLSSAVSGSAVTDLTEKVKQIYYRNIENALVDEMPTGYTFQALRSSIDSAVTSLSKQNIQQAVDEKSTQVFNTPNSLNIDGILSTIGGILGAGYVADLIDEKYTNLLASKSIIESKKFDINNADNIEKVAMSSKGFADPNANYPTKDYADLPDTNKLAQGEIRGTPLQERIRNRMRSAKLPNGESWDQPESSYKAQYPYNKVTQTESGHIIEFDDTPGAERIHIFHRSGTFVEIDPNGSVISRTVGSDYKIVDKNGYIAIAGKANVSVTGSCNVHIGGDCNIEVVGDAIINSGNDAQVNCAGRLQLSAGEAIDMRAPKIYIEADEEFHLTADTKANIDAKLLNIKVDTKANIETTSTLNIKSGENINVQATGEYNSKAKGLVKLESDTDVSVKSGSKLRMQSAGMGSFKFGGMMAMDYTTAQFANNQSVTADSAGTATGAETAEYSKSGLITTRSPMLEDVLDDPQPMGLADQYSLLSENETEDYSSQRQRLIDLGLATPAELDTAPVQGDSDAGSGGAKTELVVPNSDLKNATKLPDNYKLSPNFTLAMLSSRAAVSKDTVVAQRDLSYGEIVYNLQNLALNVLEPIYAVYPDMIVTSGFRDAASSSATSQHPIGMAVDIQFKGMSKKDYFSTAKKLKECVQFDQFLLEYCSYTNNPWIHISLKPANNRNQTLTFWNHKKHGEGLTDLA